MMEHLKDLSGNGNDGTLEECPWQENNLSFDGQDDFVAIGEMNYSNVTVEAVVEYNSLGSTEQCIVANFEAGGYGLTYMNNKNLFEFYTDKYYYVWGNAPIVNKKYFLSGRYDENVARLRENNNNYTNPIVGTITKPAYNTIMTIGGNPHKNSAISNYLSGIVHTVRIYDRTLTDEEVQKNYEIDKARFNLE